MLADYDRAINRNYRRVERYELKLGDEKQGKDLSYNDYAEWLRELHIKALLPDGLPYEVAETVIAYCIANKPDDSDYVILPVSNFDAYFGSTSFSHKWLNLFPDTLLERDKQSFGVCRVRLGNSQV